MKHAQVAAWHKGQAPEAYIDALPLDKVEEVRASAPAMIDGELRDRHVEMGVEGYRLPGYVLAHSQVKTVSLEYGGYGPMFESRSSLPALSAQLRRLREMG